MTSASASRADQAVRHRAARRGRARAHRRPAVRRTRQRQPALSQGRRRRGAARARLPGARRELGDLRARRSATSTSISAPMASRVSYHAVLQARRPGDRLRRDASKADRDGSLEFTGTATPKTDFLTARTGFVVLHPLKGVAGQPVEVEHVDGTVEKSKFPELVNPIQPFLQHPRAHPRGDARPEGHRAHGGRHLGDGGSPQLDRRVVQDLRAAARPAVALHLEGRRAGQAIGDADAERRRAGGRKRARAREAIEVEARRGDAARRMPPVGLGMPAEEIDHAIAATRPARSAPRRGCCICHFDPRAEARAERARTAIACCASRPAPSASSRSWSKASTTSRTSCSASRRWCAVGAAAGRASRCARSAT